MPVIISIQEVNPARAGMILTTDAPPDTALCKPRASGDDPESPDLRAELRGKPRASGDDPRRAEDQLDGLR